MIYTLLDATQLILSAMDSDEVNSINDTVESYQVAVLLKSVYYDIITDLRLPEHETLIQLTPSGDITQPTLMTIPSTVTKIRRIAYDNKSDTDTYSEFKEVEYKPFDQFVTDQQSLINQASDVGELTFTLDGDDFKMMYRSDKHPQFYTTADDQILLFDSYDSDVDSTLQEDKTECVGVKYPTFTLDDDFVPDLHPTQFSYYINRAKVRAFAELKQAQNQEAASEARRQKIIVAKRKRTAGDLEEIFKVPRYGRAGGPFNNRIPKSLKQSW